MYRSEIGGRWVVWVKLALRSWYVETLCWWFVVALVIKVESSKKKHRPEAFANGKET
jgi:hypothetical protein